MDKKYLLLLNSKSAALLASLLNDDFEYLEVQGMDLDNQKYKAIVTPVIDINEPSKQDDAKEEQQEN